jgi:hypothetical protein
MSFDQVLSDGDDWFEDLQHDRREWMKWTRKNEFERGIRNATVEKYPDPTHFIFELLQNAEDQGASYAHFAFKDDGVVFEHDGSAFTRDDVRGITGIGNTTKLDQANKIGCFGIGFKSVFAVTDAPEIHTIIDGETVAFSIRDLVVPDKVSYRGVAGVTRIILPLSPEAKATAIESVKDRLQSIGPRAMLFLDRVKAISWVLGETSGSYVARDEGPVRVLSRSEGGFNSEERVRIFSRALPTMENRDNLSVKLAFRLSQGGKIEREAEPTKLAVYFETEERTGLYFQVHGPFELTDNRANIKRDNEWNTFLAGEVGQLAVEALGQMKDEGLLDRSLLGVLPIPKDALEAPWEGVREAISEAFRTRPLTPTQFGEHAPSVAVVRGPSDLRDLLRDEGLQALKTSGTRRWSISGAQRNDREDLFLTAVGVGEWGYPDFVQALANGLGWIKRPEVEAWLSSLDDDQLRRFYGQLEAARRGASFHAVAHLSIVKLEDGSFVWPSKALLPPAGDEDERDTEGSKLPFVYSALITGRRGKDTVDILSRLGVPEVKERDHLEALIESQAASERLSDRAHLTAMRRYIRWWQDHKDADPFEGAEFLRSEGVPGLRNAAEIYIDAPFVETGLAVIHEQDVRPSRRFALWTGYKALKQEPFLALIRACGAQDRLVVEKCGVPWDHELRKRFKNRRETDTRTVTNYRIPDLAYLLGRKDPNISQLIWNAMSAAPGASLRAVYSPNRTLEQQSAASTLVDMLTAAAWLPDAQGVLHKPEDLGEDDLAHGYSVKGNEPWLRAIEFGGKLRHASEKGQKQRQAAESIGLPAAVADRLSRLSATELRSVGAELLRKLDSGELLPPSFPEHSPSNPQRRAAKVAERAGTAPEKTYEVRERSVRVSDGEVRQSAKTYLADLYTNDDGDMVCQACHDRMPFRMLDGTPYFEAVACVADEQRELRENHLALCPNCAAKWRHANAANSDEVLAAVAGAEGLEISAQLADHPETIRFVETHMADLRAALG